MGNGCSCYRTKLSQQADIDFGVPTTINNRKSISTDESLIMHCNTGNGVKDNNIDNKPCIDKKNSNSNYDICNSNIDTKKCRLNRSITILTNKAKEDKKAFLLIQKQRNNSYALHQRNSAFLTRTNIHIGIYGYFQSGKKTFCNQILSSSGIKPSIDNKAIEIDKKISFENKTYDVKLCVCPCNDFESFNKKTIDFFIVLYDSTSYESFEYAKDILRIHLKERISIDNNNSRLKSNCFFIANKIDLRNDSNNIVNVDSFLKKNKYLHYHEVSSRNNANSMEVMRQIFEIVDFQQVVDNFGIEVANHKLIK